MDVVKVPDVIYLQVEYDGEPCKEVTWCMDRVNDSDVEYVRADLRVTTNASPPDVQKKRAHRLPRGIPPRSIPKPKPRPVGRDER